MSRFSKVAYLLLAGLMIIGAVGCTKKPGVQQGSDSKLEDAQSAAQDAEMSFGEYEDFVYSACLVDQEDPVGAWRSVEKEQERVCNLLGDKKELHIVSEGTDLTMRVEGRK